VRVVGILCDVSIALPVNIVVGNVFFTADFTFQVSLYLKAQEIIKITVPIANSGNRIVSQNSSSYYNRR
jgi:hypothetical protein